MNVEILHEDEAIIVIDKPAGMLVHSGNGSQDTPTVVDALGAKIDDSDDVRPGIVHRLDKDTSGVLVVARDQETKAFLQRQFKERSVEKTYLAAVRGRLKHPEARLEWPIGRHHRNPLKRTVRADGREAISTYRVVEEVNGNSLLEVSIETGRTHQIRVHMQYLGHPVLGDSLYGGKTKGLARHFLHAHRISFTHPQDGKVAYISELAADLRDFWYNTDQE